MTSNSFIINNENSKVEFTVKKLGFLTIKGSLGDFSGEIYFDKKALDQANFNVSVGTSTINTGNTKRDEHLKSKDFFHVSEHPKIHFQSKSIKSISDGFEMLGQLTILGRCQEVAIPFSFHQGLFKGSFSLNRLDYKLGEKFPTFIVGKTIQISINCKIKN